MLRQQGRNDLADAVMNGTIGAKEAFSVMQGEKAADTAFQRQKDLAAFNAGLTAPKDTRTAQIKNYEYFLAQGKTPDEAAALAKTGDVFNLGGKSDFQTALMKKQADQYVKYTDDATAASDALNNLSIMRQLSAGDTFYSGIGAETLLEAKKAIVALGGNPDAVSDAESFNAIAKKTALDIMGGSLGVGFSNADRDFVEGMVPILKKAIGKLLTFKKRYSSAELTFLFLLRITPQLMETLLDLKNTYENGQRKTLSFLRQLNHPE